MASSSSTLSVPSSSASLCQNWEHDVFPSFHGPDVRKSFLSHVLKEFKRKAINLFIDNDIKRGEFIGPELERAIRGSKIAVVLLSKNYASSSWCLDELVEIMKKESGQIVITIFYRVDPTDVRKQTGYFGKVFKNTCQGRDKNKTETWRKALEGVGNIAGYHLSNRDDEALMIEDMAADISRKLNHSTPLRDFDHLIGMGGHMQKMEQFLCLDLNEVRMIGIWGPPGIGKTTIARFLLNKFSSEFQNCAMMVNIKGSYPRPCFDEYNAKLQLQNEMLSQMTNHDDTVIPHLGVAQGRLGNRKVLLVLDDVDQLAQLDALAKTDKWFGLGSRIIITTEDLRLLWAHGINHIYKVNFPSNDEALQIFCTYAFDQKYPKDGFEELARTITSLVGELPLGLKVMGSHFGGFSSKEEWSMEVSRLRTNLNRDIESILRFSYDALCDEDKFLFLHIACFFNYEYMEKVEAYLAESFKNVRQGLHALAEKSLISIEYGHNIRMHNLLAQLGKDIVRKHTVREPGQRQFLVDDNDICEVLNDCRAITKSVIGIHSKDGFDATKKTFEGISSLQFLRVGYDFPKIISVSSLPPKLRLLDWECLPMKCLPSTINLEFLVELRMHNSKLKKLWDGIKLLPNLKWMDLQGSSNLKKLPNLSMATNLLELRLCDCSSLKELPSSIGSLRKLLSLNLKRCSKLKALPININMESLNSLDLTDCSSLKRFPEISTNITYLDLIGTSIKKIPWSIRSWSRLDTLGMPYSENLNEFPDIHNKILNGMQRLPDSLKYMYLNGCLSLVSLPQLPDSLELLNLNGCSSLVSLPQLPDSLRVLDLKGYSSMVSLPQLPDSLRELNLSGCSSLVSLTKLPDSLQELDANNCESLEKLDCSFWPPRIRLKFVNCFKLNQEARDLIILKTSIHDCAVLPGKEVPECFTYRAYGNSVTVKLNQMPLPTSTKFKACFLFDNNGKDKVDSQGVLVSCNINSKQKPLIQCYLSPIVTEHLYVIDIETEKVSQVTSTELVFDFKLIPDDFKKNWEIKECGILQLLE